MGQRCQGCAAGPAPRGLVRQWGWGQPRAGGPPSSAGDGVCRPLGTGPPRGSGAARPRARGGGLGGGLGLAAAVALCGIPTPRQEREPHSLLGTPCRMSGIPPCSPRAAWLEEAGASPASRPRPQPYEESEVQPLQAPSGSGVGPSASAAPRQEEEDALSFIRACCSRRPKVPLALCAAAAGLLRAAPAPAVPAGRLLGSPDPLACLSPPRLSERHRS